MTRRKVLLIGASGSFGSRLAIMLARHSGIELILAARRREPLDELAVRLRAAHPAAHVTSLVFDRSNLRQIGDISPWLVIDASGPFQGGDYALPHAALECGAHYVDLADARDFVSGFVPALDTLARARSLLAVTGASSTPALSHAALAPLVEGWQRIDDVVVAISPGAQAPIGLSVVQAILSYAGQPLQIFKDGRWQQVSGWSGARRVFMPGLGLRWVSICETPDLDLLPKNFPIRQNATFLAGLELTVMHLGLSALSSLVRWGILKTLQPFAAPSQTIARYLQGFGSDRGGMLVTARGRDHDDCAALACWSLLAEANAGPNVPAAAAAAMTHGLLTGTVTAIGAKLCVGLLDCDDILAQLAALPIKTRTQHSLPNDPALFRRLIGRAWDKLPAAVQIVHSGLAPATFTGNAVARTSRNSILQLLMGMRGLPKAGIHDIAVTIDPDLKGETWSRKFGRSTFSSRLSSTSRIGIFEEAFGPVAFAFEMAPTGRGVTWHFSGWTILGIPIPKRFAPRIRATAKDIAGDYRFRVVVAHPWLGLLFAYRGKLTTAA